jgi:hypothetical protein
MEDALQRDLQTSIRSRVTGTFDADSTGVMDAGIGRSFVGLQIATALAAGTTLTFMLYGGGDELSSDPAEGDLDAVKNHNNDGSASSLYTIEVAAETGWFPLDAAIFNGGRFLQILSDQDNSDATIVGVSKPV